MFERFTDRARRVLVLAQDEARRLRHSFIGTEHLLLGLLRDGESAAAAVLAGAGLTLDGARRQVERLTEAASGHASASPPFTPRAKKVLELSLRQALQHGDDHITPEHLLLGMVTDGEGVAARVLATVVADPAELTSRVLGAIGATAAPAASTGRAAPARLAAEAGGPVRCPRCGTNLLGSARYRVLDVAAGTETDDPGDPRAEPADPDDPRSRPGDPDHPRNGAGGEPPATPAGAPGTLGVPVVYCLVCGTALGTVLGSRWQAPAGEQREGPARRFVTGLAAPGTPAGGLGVPPTRFTGPRGLLGGYRGPSRRGAGAPRTGTQRGAGTQRTGAQRGAGAPRGGPRPTWLAGSEPGPSPAVRLPEGWPDASGPDPGTEAAEAVDLRSDGRRHLAGTVHGLRLDAQVQEPGLRGPGRRVTVGGSLGGTDVVAWWEVGDDGRGGPVQVTAHAGGRLLALDVRGSLHLGGHAGFLRGDLAGDVGGLRLVAQAVTAAGGFDSLATVAVFGTLGDAALVLYASVTGDHARAAVRGAVGDRPVVLDLERPEGGEPGSVVVTGHAGPSPAVALAIAGALLHFT